MKKKDKTNERNVKDCRGKRRRKKKKNRNEGKIKTGERKLKGTAKEMYRRNKVGKKEGRKCETRNWEDDQRFMGRVN